ncbi:MAG: hypothetical protein JJV88_04100 [Sulfurovum sp.]|nr:hypothetical protein [Sulfurovaceae bacterium]
MLPIIDTQSQRWIIKRDKKISWLHEQGANKKHIKSYFNRWSRWATVLVFLGIPVHSLGDSYLLDGSCRSFASIIADDPAPMLYSHENVCLWIMAGKYFSSSDSCSIIATEPEPSSDMSLPPVTTPSTGGGSTSGGSIDTPPTQPKEEEEKVILEQRPTGNAEGTGTKPELDNVTKLYIATFGRAPKKEGSNYWLYESKLNLEDIARSFFDQPETLKLNILKDLVIMTLW